MNKMPFISMDDYNIKNVRSSSLSRFLNWIGRPAHTKREYLDKYYEYSLHCPKEFWLRFVSDICEANSFHFNRYEWSRKYDDWEFRDRSYSVRFF